MEVSVLHDTKKEKRKVQGVPQSQTAALPRHQEEKETDTTKQAHIEQTHVNKVKTIAFGNIEHTTD